MERSLGGAWQCQEGGAASTQRVVVSKHRDSLMADPRSGDASLGPEGLSGWLIRLAVKQVLAWRAEQMADPLSGEASLGLRG